MYNEYINFQIQFKNNVHMNNKINILISKSIRKSKCYCWELHAGGQDY